VRGFEEDGGLITMQDLANWQVHIEEPLHTNYRGIEVYKLPIWQQGPAMLEALNILENADLKSMGYNSPKYLHLIYQTMSLAFADRDFYYGDPYFPPAEPVAGLLSKLYAKTRYAQIDWSKNDPSIKPGDPYPFQPGGGKNPYAAQLAAWNIAAFAPKNSAGSGQQDAPPPATQTPASARSDFVSSSAPLADAAFLESFYAGTTSIESADEEGWVVSVTPSGGWVPAVIAGHTGIGLSQRAQSFVTDASDGPFNVIEPGKRPRVTLTPTMGLKDGKPYLAFAVQGGDSQDQNLLQFFLNIVEFGMTVQQAVEAPNINSYQMRSSFGEHEARPGLMEAATSLPDSARTALRSMGYTLQFVQRSSGPINAILFDRNHGTMWGGSSNHGEDYGVAW
jgi:gamma-glutamyltranspeptidase / glutathione hydrolase